ncbi:protein RNA-directed DNA methylation 3-like isoform X2 [Vicia villosa]|uniref:protein RNA-directed DNA methylation 3-like isoform X2 n=1 Tax=Vicia villosa TaxID=3911 RepID=UPI00273C57BA|nr:protein RNA-directed DNA methylation 3-like isoform X2 [Vicia villosa]
MKMKLLIYMFFLCALILISTMEVETFKGGNQFGAVEETKTKSGRDSWRDWGGSFWGDEEVNTGGEDKDGGHGSGEKGKKSKNGKDDWRDWGGSFWGDEEGNGGKRGKEAGHNGGN